eukprot:GILI01021753.1.p1 GENE.GILI01021753.1~~GILI01021753.1.p1  ORF type:complete len:104 (+),score=17.93 GILI01021753.1:54-365(+)
MADDLDDILDSALADFEPARPAVQTSSSSSSSLPLSTDPSSSLYSSVSSSIFSASEVLFHSPSWQSPHSIASSSSSPSSAPMQPASILVSRRMSPAPSAPSLR